MERARALLGRAGLGAGAAGRAAAREAASAERLALEEQRQRAALLQASDAYLQAVADGEEEAKGAEDGEDPEAPMDGDYDDYDADYDAQDDTDRAGSPDRYSGAATPHSPPLGAGTPSVKALTPGAGGAMGSAGKKYDRRRAAREELKRRRRRAVLSLHRRLALLPRQGAAVARGDFVRWLRRGVEMAGLEDAAAARAYAALLRPGAAVLERADVERCAVSGTWARVWAEYRAATRQRAYAAPHVSAAVVTAVVLTEHDPLAYARAMPMPHDLISSTVSSARAAADWAMVLLFLPVAAVLAHRWPRARLAVSLARFALPRRLRLRPHPRWESIAVGVCFFPIWLVGLVVFMVFVSTQPEHTWPDVVGALSIFVALAVTGVGAMVHFEGLATRTVALRDAGDAGGALAAPAAGAFPGGRDVIPDAEARVLQMDARERPADLAALAQQRQNSSSHRFAGRGADEASAKVAAPQRLAPSGRAAVDGGGTNGHAEAGERGAGAEGGADVALAPGDGEAGYRPPTMWSAGELAQRGGVGGAYRRPGGRDARAELRHDSSGVNREAMSKATFLAARLPHRGEGNGVRKTQASIRATAEREALPPTTEAAVWLAVDRTAYEALDEDPITIACQRWEPAVRKLLCLAVALTPALSRAAAGLPFFGGRSFVRLCVTDQLPSALTQAIGLRECETEDAPPELLPDVGEVAGIIANGTAADLLSLVESNSVDEQNTAVGMLVTACCAIWTFVLLNAFLGLCVAVTWGAYAHLLRCRLFHAASDANRAEAFGLPFFSPRFGALPWARVRSLLGARGALDMRLGAVTAAVCVGLSATLLALAVITFVLGTDQGAGDLHRHAAPVFAPLAGLVSVVLLAWATLFVSLGSEVRGLADDERAMLAEEQWRITNDIHGSAAWRSEALERTRDVLGRLAAVLERRDAQAPFVLFSFPAGKRLTTAVALLGVLAAGVLLGAAFLDAAGADEREISIQSLKLFVDANFAYSHHHVQQLADTANSLGVNVTALTQLSQMANFLLTQVDMSVIEATHGMVEDLHACANCSYKVPGDNRTALAPYWSRLLETELGDLVVAANLYPEQLLVVDEPEEGEVKAAEEEGA